MEIVSLEHKESGLGWRIWPQCNISRAYCRNLGGFSIPGEPRDIIEYFRRLGHSVQVRTNQFVFKYPNYTPEQLEASLSE